MSDRPKNIGQLGEDLDAFLRDLSEISDAAGRDLEQLTAALVQPTEAAHNVRDRLLSALSRERRFERFADTVAELLDIERERALHLLDQLDDRALYNELSPGIELLWVDGGPRVAHAVRGFVRVSAGLTFPEHEHLGDERVLVLQGSFIDPARALTFRPGDVDTMPPGTSHLHIVPADGTDLLMLSVVQNGVTVGEQTFLPNQVPTRHT